MQRSNKNDTREVGAGTYGRYEKSMHGLEGKPEGRMLSGRRELTERIILA
jgi:hypothetical protein